MTETKSSEPIAQRIMAAWMRLQGMREDEIAMHTPDTIEVEIENLEATVRMQEKSAEQWPKWYVTCVDGSEHCYECRAESDVYCHEHGRETKQRASASMLAQDTLSFREVTEAEAKARLTPSLSTCPDCGEFRGHGHEDVCHMAWVTQDRVPVRTGLDQVHWSFWTDNEMWVQAAGDWNERRHGFCDTGNVGTLHVRCRRRDLPPVTATLMWPKWYIHKDPDQKWYVRRDAANHRTIVTEGGCEYPRAWDEIEERYVSRGWWIEVTESEAKARLTTPLSTCHDWVSLLRCVRPAERRHGGYYRRHDSLSAGARTVSEDQSRAEFEAWISSQPYERSLYRYSESGSFPGQYRERSTHLAWEAWKESRTELRNILSEVASCGISRTAEGRYHEVQIPLELWHAIQDESSHQTSD